MLNYTFLFVILLAFLPMGIVIYLTRQDDKASSKTASTSRRAPALPKIPRERSL